MYQILMKYNHRIGGLQVNTPGASKEFVKFNYMFDRFVNGPNARASPPVKEVEELLLQAKAGLTAPEYELLKKKADLWLSANPYKSDVWDS